MAGELRWRRVQAKTGLNRWAMTEPDEIPYPGTPRPMPDRVDYRFSNGPVDTGDFPCREALKATLGQGEVDFPTGPFSAIYPGGESPDVDFSRFCHVPTLIRRAFRCRIRARSSGPVRLRVATCGSVVLWVDGRQVLRFEPFVRNRPHSTAIALDVGRSAREITVRLEDLHERDTTCFFSIVPLSGPQLETALDIGGADHIDDALETLLGLRTNAVFYRDGTVTLVADHAPARDLPLRLVSRGQFPRGGIVGDPDAPPAIDCALGPGRTTAPLFDVADAATGCLRLRLIAEAGPARIERDLGTTVLPPSQQIAGATLEARKTQAAAAIAGHAAFEPSVALLLLSRDAEQARAGAIVACALDNIEARYDCADFSILPLLRIWRDHRDQLADPLRARLRQGLLGFRYWLDEPGNDVMWFWSENHVLCFHVAQLIAGTLFGPARFANSGKTGDRLAGEARDRLHRWFDAIEIHGLAEWNSAAYYPIDMLALLSLHDMAGDADLVRRAAALLDTIFVMTGLHTTGGVPAGSQGRAYEKELLAGPATELGSVAAIAFGGPWPSGYDRAAALFCLSGYAPPAIARDFARPGPGTTLEARYTQGLDHAARLSLWKSANVQLSTVSEHATGAKGHQQHVIDVQFAAHPMARVWINQPGELKAWGERRPSLLAGNPVLPRVAQHGQTAFVLQDLTLDPDAIGLGQLFAARAAFDAVIVSGAWLFLRCGAGCAAIWCSTPPGEVDHGAYRHALWRAQAPVLAWAVQVASAAGDAAFAAFCAAARSARLELQPDARRLEVHGLAGADFALSFDGPFVRNGVALSPGTLSSIPHVGRNGGPLAPWK